MIDITKIKKELSLDEVEFILNYFGGEPSRVKSNILISRTIDHNPRGEGSRKLYFYDNIEGGLFKSYTGDEVGTFDIFELIIKIYKIQKNKDIELPQAVKIVCNLLNKTYEDDDTLDFDGNALAEDIKVFEKYKKIEEKAHQERKLEYKVYDATILSRLPQPRLEIWEKEDISYETIKDANIRFNPQTQSIVIPFYDENNNLIGIRERTIVKEYEDKYGKYRPSCINGQLYNHPLGLSIYGLNKSKDNILRWRKAIIFESEKSVLKYRSLFGASNDISVAVCGSSLSMQQVCKLIQHGAEELIIAFDRDYEEKGDATFKKQVNNLTNIHLKYSPKINVTFLWDNLNLLSPHDSPIDKGKDIFLQLYYNRIQL